MFHLKDGINTTVRTAGYLGKRKVRGLMFVSVTVAVQNIILKATDGIILGNLIGTDAVSGTVLVAPALALGEVFGILISSGAGILYTRAVSNYDDTKSRHILGMAMVTAVIFGALLSASSLIGGDLFLDATGAEGIVRTYAGQYLSCYRFSFLISPLLALLMEISYIDGDEKRTVFSNIALFAGNVVLSYIFVLRMGVFGASLGSALGKVLALAVIVSHFFSSRYKRIPGLVFDKDDLKNIFLLGGADCVEKLFDFIYGYLANLFIIDCLGHRYLAVLGISSVVYELMVIGEGISDSMKTMLLSYRGDGNSEAMKGLLRYGSKLTLAVGFVFIGTIWFAAPVFPMIFGLKDDALMSFTIWACRLTSFSSIACLLMWIFLEYYLDIGKYRLQILGWAMDSLFVRLPLNVVFSLVFGAVGFWIGEALCTYVTLTIMIIIICHRYGRKAFPFLMETDERDSLNLSCMAEPGQIIKTRDDMIIYLNDKSVPASAVNIAALVLEELGMIIKEQSGDDPEPLNMDVFVTCYRNRLNMVIWFDGPMIDLSDVDSLSPSLRVYLLFSLFSGFDEKHYQPTAGYNRAGFVIPYERSFHF
ncbi:MAG: oligosaccharide flippase family protein [Lachnospiraceae bacterium]|nr:oligosaccharide flippase family protein [Lachnospiraceae bacterium]